jgi:hypothetical protein
MNNRCPFHHHHSMHPINFICCVAESMINIVSKKTLTLSQILLDFCMLVLPHPASC